MIANTQFDWRRAHHPLVREVGWCLFSEPLVDTLPDITTPWPAREDRGAREILALLDQDPRPLQQHLAASGDKRLGARFESAWSYFFTHHPRYHLLAQNWPVQQRGRTLGALDFLFRDNHLDAVIHAEMAIKFYLYKADHPGTALSRWIGPNPDDSLQLKLSHLTNHQLALTNRPEARQQLRQAALPLPDLKAVLVKGYLFHPLGQRIATPTPVNPHHLRGEWLYQCDLPALLSQQRGQWTVVPRQQWLMPASGSSDLATLRQRVSALVAETGQPVMIYRSGGGEDRAGTRRYFVVPAGWPDRKHRRMG